jgi:hypothetical protein
MGMFASNPKETGDIEIRAINLFQKEKIIGQSLAS